MGGWLMVGELVGGGWVVRGWLVVNGEWLVANW